MSEVNFKNLIETAHGNSLEVAIKKHKFDHWKSDDEMSDAEVWAHGRDNGAGLPSELLLIAIEDMQHVEDILSNIDAEDRTMKEKEVLYLVLGSLVNLRAKLESAANGGLNG